MKAKKYCLEVSFVDHHPQISLFWKIYISIEYSDFLDELRSYVMRQDFHMNNLDQRPEYLLRMALENET